MSGVLAAAADTGVQLGTGEAVVFWILGPVALAGALGMVFSRNAVHSALWLVLTMLCLGVFYVVQDAPFLGAVQVIVYTGAIMILFLFVLMLVGRDSSDSVVETLRGQRVGATLLGVGFAGVVAAGVARATQDLPVTGLDAAQGAQGNIPAIAELLFTRYLLAFEVTSALLITAAVGAMVLAHIEREPGSRRSQKDLSRARFLGEHPSTPSGPGSVEGRSPRNLARESSRCDCRLPGSRSMCASTMAPTAAVISSALVTSKASSYRENSSPAMAWMLPSAPWAPSRPVTGRSRVARAIPAPTRPAKPTPSTVAAMRCPRSVSTTESEESRPTSMSTNRNRIMIAPV